MTPKVNAEDPVNLRLEIILSQLKATTVALQELLEERKKDDDGRAD